MLIPKIKNFSNELHSLRGIAALIVVLFHLRGILNEIFHTNYTNIFNGSACVILFFVLSGLVVTSSILKVENNNNFLQKYYIRRIFRLLPLMILTVTIGGIFLFQFNSAMPIPLYDKSWGDFNVKTWMVSYVGYSLKANPPSWSIWIELVASLLLPIFLLVNKSKPSLFLMGIFLVLITFIDIKSQHYWHFYLICFFCGATILYWGEAFSDQVYSFFDSKFGFYVFISFLWCMFYVPRLLLNYTWVGNNLIVLWETLFISPIIAVIYYRPEMFHFFKHNNLIFLGNISFSIYLNHMILMIIFFNIYLLNFQANHLVVMFLIPIYLTIVVMLSNITYKHIELYGSYCGQKLIDKIYSNK